MNKKVALISGSTRGIGKAIAFELAKNNIIPIINGRKKDKKTEMLINSLKKISPQSNIYYFDVADEKKVRRAINQILNQYGKIDILINNAGILANSLFINMKFSEFEKVFKTNVYGTFFLTQACLPNMITHQWGRIINISSVMAYSGDYGQTNYSASKAAILGFTKTLAKEVAKYNITVNAVCPGLVDTDILSVVSEKYMTKLLERIPMRRLAKTEEIGKLVVFLVSENSKYINGSAIDINGGMH